MLSDVLVVFDHLKHTRDDPGQRRAPTTLDAVLRRRGRDDRRGAPRCSTGRCPRPTRDRAPRPVPEFTSNMDARAVRGHGRRGSSSTSTRATRSRSCRRSAGARRWRASTRSRSTAGCASSTRRPTCTSWTSCDFQIAGASPEPLLTRRRPPRVDAADRRHAPARRRPGRAAGRREGARRARDARRPGPQRPRPRLRVRQRRGRHVHGDRDATRT